MKFILSLLLVVSTVHCLLSQQMRTTTPKRIENDSNLKVDKELLATRTIINRVDFNLTESSGNTWPIKIGQLLRNATVTRRFILIESSCPIYVLFSKCGMNLEDFPNWVNQTLFLGPHYVKILNEFQTAECDDPEEDDLILLELVSEKLPISGSIEFFVSEDPEVIRMYMFTIRATLVGMVILLVAGASFATYFYLHQFGLLD
ncbi:hypothetical protein CAEBREN_01754 [Caenorhabditis brenneri]|uniref:Uncharacterized protein n=1 Tax=Caenorhabditis brenneri TaxID=135651 RepID=G0N1W4_CAEBE|nr:hypothetical protein CAEBREN_01754 [Caenorhabditis brenneri]